MGERVFTCRACGERGVASGARGPKPHYHAECAPTKQARHKARLRELREELAALRLEVAELRRDDRLTDSQRRRLALVTDLLAAWTRWSGGGAGGGAQVPDDEALAELTLQACRAGVSSTLGRTRSIELAGAALARALATHEVIVERNARAVASRAA